MLENIPPSVRERLARLSRENKQLKAKVSITKIRVRVGREALSTVESWERSRTAVCLRTSPPSVRERLARLSREYKQLKAKVGNRD
jgi:hypothetical protein